MANPKHIEILKQGAEIWNKWRDETRFEVGPDLSSASLARFDFRRMDLTGVELRNADLGGADLSRVNLLGSDLSCANLNSANMLETEIREGRLSWATMNNVTITGADLSKTDLHGAELKAAVGSHALIHNANLSQANLTQADLHSCHMSGVNLRKATLKEANLRNVCLSEADLREVDLEAADLSGADLSYANLVQANLQNANLTGCRVYASCSWDTKLQGATQVDLVITRLYEPNITVDHFEVAQFIYLLINNEKIRDVIDTITSKMVLILGRFTPDRKPVLDALREELRKRNYLPVLFDFDKPGSRNFIETVSTLAHMAQFVIADFTDAKIVLQEVQHIVPNIAVPVMPLLLEGSGEEPTTLYDLRVNQRSLLDTFRYKDSNHLISSLGQKVIEPAKAKARELLDRRLSLQAAEPEKGFAGNGT